MEEQWIQREGPETPWKEEAFPQIEPSAPGANTAGRARLLVTATIKRRMATWPSRETRHRGWVQRGGDWSDRQHARKQKQRHRNHLWCASPFRLWNARRVLRRCEGEMLLSITTPASAGTLDLGAIAFSLRGPAREKTREARM